MEFSGILNGPCPKSFHSLAMSVTYKYAQCEMSAWLIENVSNLVTQFLSQNVLQ